MEHMQNMHSFAVIWLAPKLPTCPLNDPAAVLYMWLLQSDEYLLSVILSISQI